MCGFGVGVNITQTAERSKNNDTELYVWSEVGETRLLSSFLGQLIQNRQQRANDSSAKTGENGDPN